MTFPSAVKAVAGLVYDGKAVETWSMIGASKKE
jgi:hypothetical protein